MKQVWLMAEDTINNVIFERRSQYIKPDFYLWGSTGAIATS
ncbi:MAG: hypothetical protein QNJ68_01110 [Microcoleaceae cyanobacterium MO_207.B10]|nr:hypothetical protein [Microcoleaceae cyanobacterium MO_207.B10]